MMKNKKDGFTLVELLAVIVILGILATIGVVVTSRYLTESRKKSYKIMSQTIYEATMNCMTEGRCVVPSKGGSARISTDTLIKYGYLKKLDNPKNNGKDCSGTVVVQNVGTSKNEYQQYKYSVSLNCEGVADNTIIWPDEKKNNTNLDEIKISNSNNNSTEGSNTEKTICRRAKTLHTETCNEIKINDGVTPFCSRTGYSVGSTITYGSLGISNVLNSGDAFDCDVNGDGVYDAATERFYYVTDLDIDTAVLLYYSSVSGGIPTNTLGYGYGNVVENNTGPTVAIKQLPTINQWKNIRLKNTKRAITNELGEDSTVDGELPKNFSYDGYTARLLTFQEVEKACTFSTTMWESAYTLSGCEYMLENTQFSNPIAGQIVAFWLETPISFHYSYIMYVGSIGLNRYFSTTHMGIRPAIEVAKKNIDY